MNFFKKAVCSFILVLTVFITSAAVTLTIHPQNVLAASQYEQGFLGGEYQAARTKLGDNNTANPTQRVLDTVSAVLKFIFGFIGIILVLLVTYAGFIWMTAAGEPKKVATAKSYLINAAIGLVILLSASGASIFIFNQLYARITTTQ